MTGRNGEPDQSPTGDGPGTGLSAEPSAWAPESAPAADDVRLPGYSDFRLVAQGGEGRIYRAWQDGLGRYVAVKVINVDDPARLERFRRELEITVRLGRQHPHIVTVLDTGTVPGGRPCIVMEYYDLGSLHDRLRERGPLPVNDVVAAGTAVADALAFAHGQGFLHRDVKPQNILVLPTSYVLADFGIARMADAGHSASLHMVSYRHAAPQMIEGRPPAAADDVWSLGSTMFTLLDGAAPFAGGSPDEDTMLSYLGRVRSTEPRRLRRADVPPGLDAVIARCLSKEREDRYPSAAALRDALAGIRMAGPGWAPLSAAAVVDPAAVDTGPAEPPTGAADATVVADGVTTRLDEETVTPGYVPPTDIDYSTDYPEPPTREVAFQPPAPGEPFADPLAVPAGDPRDELRRSGRRGLLWTLVALVAGVGVGVTATLLGGQDTAGQPVPGETSSAVSTTTPAGTPTGTPASAEASTAVPQGGDPAVTPKLNRLEDNGNSIRLRWSDPSGGRVQFVVVDVSGAVPAPLITVAAGQTTATVDRLDPAARQYCFQVVALGLDDPANQRGASARVCAVRNR